MKKRHPRKKNVLLVNITRLGDMLQATPTIAGIKAENPDCKITVLVEKQFEAICHTIPNIDVVRSIDLTRTVRALARDPSGCIEAYEYVSEVVEELRKERFDYCLNMSSSAYTALLLRLVGIENNGGWTSDEEGHRIIESDWARLFATSVFHQNRQFNSLNLVDVFRCSADVETHPKQLLINVTPEDAAYAQGLIKEAEFTNTGPLIALQAGASQMKRQWSTRNFVKLVRILRDEHQARLIMTGTKKELAIIDPIIAEVGPQNILNAAGRTNIPQLAGLLEVSDLLVTGDTGTMHMSVAAGTPVVAMFLASAFGFETGPYSEGNIIIQPIISCGPCNPNKACARPDCHDTIPPEMVAQLAIMRVRENFTRLPDNFPLPKQAIIYRSFFDQYGFCDLAQLNPNVSEPFQKYREAYRKLWMKELGGLNIEVPDRPRSSLSLLDQSLEGLEEVVRTAQTGTKLINQLVGYIRDETAPAKLLGKTNEELTNLDREIEQIGFHYAHLGPVTRMFIFAKENIQGSDAIDLASQMAGAYADLEQRAKLLGQFYSAQ